jgi:hypothetical protein
MQMALSSSVFFFWLTQPFLNRIQYETPFGTCCYKHFGTSLGPKKIIQNGVNIQDGDLTFSHFQTYKLQILESDRKLYNNK